MLYEAENNFVHCCLAYSPRQSVAETGVLSRLTIEEPKDYAAPHMAFERITVVGNIGSVEVQKSKAGNSYLRLSVAVDRSQGDSRQVVWYSVLMFGSMVRDEERMLALYSKGRLILVEGRPQVEAFIKKDGSAGLDNTIIAISMPELLDARTRA